MPLKVRNEIKIIQREFIWGWW